MQLADVMTQLEALGTEQTRKTYGRHGVIEPMFGVSYANFAILTKKLKGNHALGVELWETGNHDARVLATMIIDGSLLTDEQMERWVRQLTNYGIVAAFAGMVTQSPLNQSKMVKWLEDDNPWLCCVGWIILANLAVYNPDLPDEFFTPYLPIIQENVHTRENWVRYYMNNALIAIGRRNESLKEQALVVARAIGKVKVDHGLTWCKTPLAEEYIQRQRPERKKA